MIIKNGQVVSHREESDQDELVEEEIESLKFVKRIIKLKKKMKISELFG